MNKRSLLSALPLFILSACNSSADPAPASEEDFWAALSSHCGNAYQGGLVSDDAADADMQGAAMVMHVRECSEDRIAVPFHIQGADGKWDRSRTWVFTRTDNGYRLKHDHRHEDGEPDAVTMYGGEAAAAVEGVAQAFPVDQESIEMFKREGLDASVTNVWRVRVDPAGQDDAIYAYKLTRRAAKGAPADRDFMVEFDLTQPVPAPPAPWGFEDS